MKLTRNELRVLKALWKLTDKPDPRRGFPGVFSARAVSASHPGGMPRLRTESLLDKLVADGLVEWVFMAGGYRITDAGKDAVGAG